MGTPSSTDVSVRPANRGDLSWMACVHLAQLPHGFFARLGARYLRAYHRTFVDSPYAVALLAEYDGRRIGFVVGPIDAGAHQRFAIRRRGVRLAIAGAIALVTRPPLIGEFFRTRGIRYVRSLARALTRRRVAAHPAASGGRVPETAVLSHVAVEAGHQRHGAGSLLVRRFVDSTRAAGARRIELVTLADDRGAAGFYHRLGWRQVDESQRDGVTFARFVLEP